VAKVVKKLEVFDESFIEDREKARKVLDEEI